MLQPPLLSLLLLLACSALETAPCSATASPAAPAATAAPAAAAEAPRWRVIWIVRDATRTDAQVAALVEKAASLGATDLLFQVRGRGDAFYRSDLVPRGARAPEPADPLAAALAAAKKHGIRVHAWFNVYLVGSGKDASAPKGPEHVALAHPGWIAALEDGRSLADLTAEDRREDHIEGAFLSPASTEARAHLFAVIDELLDRYPVHGLHWDYVRFPGAKGGFETTALQAFGDREMLDAPSWEDWRIEQIGTFVREAADRARAKRPGIALSAAVIPDPARAAEVYGQDWVTWLREGWIDVAMPMAYTTSVSQLEEWRGAALAAGAPGNRLLLGLGVWKLSAEELDEQLAWSREVGVPGVSLFSWTDLGRDKGRLSVVRGRWKDK